MVETGRVIQRRYLLQRLLRQGQNSVIYQGTDQVLQRPVTVKVVPAANIAAYRAAIRATAQFSHPNIIGLYDLIVEPETLYVIQEYVEGDSFANLLQMSLASYEVVDLGMQICQALIYAGSGSRTICHGDLTPTAIMRDQQRLIRVNNFALPTDIAYFTAWNVLSGDGEVITDPHLPWGQQSEGRREDDTRAVGLLLYQLLAGRAPGVTVVEPPADGRLRFVRNTPPVLCELVARAVLRQHPQHLNNAESLYAELKTLQAQLEPPAAFPDVYAPEPAFSPVSPNPLSPVAGIQGTGKLVSALSVRDATAYAGTARHPDTNALVSVPEQNAAPTVAEIPQMAVPLVSSRLGPEQNTLQQPRRNFPALLGLGLLIFLLFFAIGYFVATAVIHP